MASSIPTPVSETVQAVMLDSAQALGGHTPSGGHHTDTLLLTIITAIVIGVYLFVIADRLKIPAIVPLLFGGVLAGPEYLDLIDPNTIADELNTLIKFAVAIILFEGGLSLDPKGYKEAGGTIRKLLTLGVLSTWLGTSVVLFLLFDLSPMISLLGGSLIIVTGPTVITPLLKRVTIHTRLHHILHYEGVLGDPIGVFVALLCLEWVSVNATTTTSAAPILDFLTRIFFGILLGVIGGIFMNFMVRQLRMQEEAVNLFVLSTILGLFGACEAIVPETGLLAVTITGLILGIKQPPYLKKIKQFQMELTDLCIACLFILLAAKLKIDEFLNLGLKGAIALAVVLFIIRPVGIFLSTRGEGMAIRDKLMLSWIAPRGIIAASMASIVGITLEDKNLPGAQILPAFVFGVIGVTVVFQGFSAGLVAKLLQVERPPRRNWIIISANKFARVIAHFIQGRGIKVFLIDANSNNVQAARREGLVAITSNAFDTELLDREDFLEVGNVLALTDNKDLNATLCKHWQGLGERVRTWRWSDKDIENENDYRHLGKVVFADLPKPSVISHQIEMGTLSQLEESDAITPNRMEIATFSGNRMALNPNVYEFKIPENDKEYNLVRLSFRVPKEPVTKLITGNRILFLHHAENLDDLFDKLLQSVISEYPDLLKSQLLEDFQKIGRERPLVLGFGASVNHVYSDKLDDSICLMAKLNQPMIDPSHSNIPVRLVFLIISPTDQQNKHLKLLASIARLLNDNRIREEIMEAKDVDEILFLLKKFEHRAELKAKAKEQLAATPKKAQDEMRQSLAQKKTDD